MNERIREFLLAENKSSAQLAEEIGVQPSGISHILSGRNNPSLDFVLKMLEKYRFLSTEWLLFGRGTMYKGSKIQTLFDGDADYEELSRLANAEKDEPRKSGSEISLNSADDLPGDLLLPDGDKSPAVEKIVWFYNNRSFKEYIPSR